MKFGVSTFVTDEGIEPAVLGPALEERGFASLFVAEHTHIPVSRETPYPGGGDLPRDYYRTLDPIVALTAAGVTTERLELGTGIALVNQRDPIILAKEMPRSTWSPGAERSSASAPAGTARRCSTTVPTRRPACPACGSTSLRSRRSGRTTRRSSTGSSSTSTRCSAGPSRYAARPSSSAAGDRRPSTGWWSTATAGCRWRAETQDGGLARAVADLRERAGRHVPVTVYAARAEADAVEQLTLAGVDEILFYLPTEPATETVERLDRMADLIT